MSVSRWVAALIDEQTRVQWPAEVRESAGSRQEARDSETLRKNMGTDIPRELL